MCADFFPFHLQKASVLDIPAILFLERYCFSPEIAFGQRRWQYLIHQSLAQTFVVYDKDVLVAILCVLPHRGWQASEVRCLAVHWQYRKQQLGSKLLSLAKTLTQNWGYFSIVLSVDTENQPALHLYQNHGFQRLRVQPHYYGWGQNAYRMRCDFSALI